VTRLVVGKEHLNLKLNFEMEAAGQAGQTKRLPGCGLLGKGSFNSSVNRYLTHLTE